MRSQNKTNFLTDWCWCRFIETSHAHPGQMHSLIQIHKVDNPVRVITSGCGTVIENLSVFVGKCLYSEVLEIESRVKDTSEMLTIIGNLNKSNTLTFGCRLASFDIINMLKGFLTLGKTNFHLRLVLLKFLNCV